MLPREKMEVKVDMRLEIDNAIYSRKSEAEIRVGVEHQFGKIVGPNKEIKKLEVERFHVQEK